MPNIGLVAMPGFPREPPGLWDTGGASSNKLLARKSESVPGFGKPNAENSVVINSHIMVGTIRAKPRTDTIKLQRQLLGDSSAISCSVSIIGTGGVVAWGTMADCQVRIGRTPILDIRMIGE